VAAVARWARWQLVSRLAAGPRVVPFAGQTTLLARAGETGVTGNIYLGLAEYREMAFTAHLLRPGDLFIDVGANAGSYTILASGVATARSIAFEPIAGTADRLDLNVCANGLADRVTVHRLGMGALPGRARFTTDEDTTNHVAASGEGGTEIEIETLDRVLAATAPTLLKIDTEGFEPEVIAGAGSVLAMPSLLAVIVETNGESARFGRTLDDVVNPLRNAGFVPCVYDPKTRRLTEAAGASTDSGNTIFVRDTALVAERLARAAPFRVAGSTL
jgi:FkbM family methyltransferase